MANAIRPQPGLMDIKLYVGGASHVEGVSDVLKLSSNENPFGPSEKAMEAFRATAQTLHRYPPTDHGSLRAVIGRSHGVDPDRVICGAGSDEIIHWLCQCYAGPGDEVIYTEHGFGMYKISARAAGATPVEVPETDRRVDVGKVLAAAGEKTKVVFITNPGNPSATVLEAGDIERLADGLPRHVLLVLDGAYAEFAEGYDGGASLVDARENVVMTRTFSKLYGLGGLRIGWGYGPKAIIDVLNRIRGPFNLSSAQLAAAEAALEDTAHVERCLSENARMRSWLTEALRGMGLQCDDSHANFVLARFGSESEADGAEERLRADGILVRKVASYKLPECLRITVGDEAGCRRVVSVLGAFREAAA